MYAIEDEENITIYDSDNRILRSWSLEINRLAISLDYKYLATYLVQYDKKGTLSVLNLSDFKVIASLPEFNGYDVFFSDEPKLYFQAGAAKIYSWNFLEPNSKPILLFKFTNYDYTIHFIHELIYRKRKIYLLYTYLTGENYRDAFLEIITIDIDTLQVETIDFGQPIPSFYRYGSYGGPEDRTIMTSDYKIIAINDPYLVTINLKNKTWKKLEFGQFELMDISNNHFLIFKDKSLQLLEYDSMKIIKNFSYPGVKAYHDIEVYFLNYHFCLNRFTDRDNSGEKAHYLNLQNGSTEKITDKYNYYYTNYQNRYLFLFDQVTKLITSIRVLQQIAKYYQIAFDMVYEIIRQLLWNYRIENRELANYLNTYTRSVGVTKEEFQKNITRLLQT